MKGLSEEAKGLKLGVYEHYKGNRYRVFGVALHSETFEEVVVYQALYGDGDYWVRPLGMFLEDVMVDGRSVSRFRIIEDKNGDD